MLGELDQGQAGGEGGDDAPETAEDRWILSRLDRLEGSVDDLLVQFQLGEAARRIQDFLWSEFFDWYVEASKIRLRAGDSSPLPILARVLDHGLRLLHPWMPFITEAIWQQLRPHLAGAEPDVAEALIVAPYPRGEGTASDEAEAGFRSVQEIVRAVRQARADHGVQAGRWAEVWVAAGGDADRIRQSQATIEALARARPLHVVGSRDEAPDGRAATAVLPRAEVIIPLGGLIDTAQERARLDKELAQIDGRLNGAEAKLANEGFRSKAPAEVVAKAEASAADLRAQRETLLERLASLP